jgi:hypothetical protein
MNLIYFTIGNNIGYIDLLNLCIESLNKFEYNGDILVISDFEEQIKNKIPFKNKVIFDKSFENINLLRSSSNKLKIYKYDFIEKYDKIMFCDVDTLWFNSPNILFDNIKEDKIYMSSEHHQELLMSSIYWSGGLMTSEELKEINDNNIKGLNGGFFGFKKSMIYLIEKIDIFFEKNINKVTDCLEQPYINTILFREKMYDTSFDKYISNNGNYIDNFDGVLLHFSAGIGNSEFKYNNMIKFFKKL